MHSERSALKGKRNIEEKGFYIAFVDSSVVLF